MLLYVSAQPFPFDLVFRSTKGGQEMKVVMLGCELLELLAIVEILFSPRAEEQPEVPSLMASLLSQQPVQHGAEGSDARSSRDEDRIAQRRPQNEIAERSLKGNLRAFVESAKMVRHKTILD